MFGVEYADDVGEGENVAVKGRGCRMLNHYRVGKSAELGHKKVSTGLMGGGAGNSRAEIYLTGNVGISTVGAEVSKQLRIGFGGRGLPGLGAAANSGYKQR